MIPVLSESVPLVTPPVLPWGYKKPAYTRINEYKRVTWAESEALSLEPSSARNLSYMCQFAKAYPLEVLM